ncbi:MAG: methyltransferase domain-containing protein [Sphaerospermopsis sp. SIO1G2]|nr:methyltransferase domain-containing protein [Sphaerospermopsis sp. SIO1G2]
MNTPADAHQPPAINFWKGWLDVARGVLDRPAAVIDDMLYKASHLAETNYAIAQDMSDKGLFKDAVFRLRIVLWVAPQHQPACYLLGCCYIALQQMEKAQAILRKAVTLQPEDAEAQFMLATLDPYHMPEAQQPTSMPDSIALNYFDSHAPSYETAQLEAGYRAHQCADEALWDALDRRRNDYHVLELGCGSGLCGMLMAEHAATIVGVDYCLPMLDIARPKRRPDFRRVYTEIIHQDIRQFIHHLREPEYDAIVAAHVFNYVGDIAMIITQAIHGLKSGGVFVFQVEPYPYEGRFGLLPKLGRFGHSDGYIRHYLEYAGFELLEHAMVSVYPDYEMAQYVARKATH